MAPGTPSLDRHVIFLSGTLQHVKEHDVAMLQGGVWKVERPPQWPSSYSASLPLKQLKLLLVRGV